MCNFLLGRIKMENRMNDIPTMLLEEIVVFPGSMVHLDIDITYNIAAAEKALSENSPVVLLPQFSLTKDEKSYFEPSEEIGVLAEVRQLVRISDSTMRVMFIGIKRVHINQLEFENKCYQAIVTLFDEEELHNCMEEEAMVRGLRDVSHVYFTEFGRVNESLLKNIDAESKLCPLVDLIAMNIMMDFRGKKKLLETEALFDRFEIMIHYITNEIGVLRIKKDYQDKVKEQVNENQKEYYLREQLKLIHKELGENDSESEADLFADKCNALEASDEVKSKILEEIKRYKGISSNSSESGMVRGYIETLLDLPWNRIDEGTEDVECALEVLERNHYGLRKVKERIIESLAVRQLTGEGEAPIICLVGPPGTGKTSIVKSVAEALQKKYIRICLGGVRDEAEIRGHRRTYIGAMPGRLAMALKKAKVSNPLILLDEIDKVSNDYKGDTFSALLEVLDPEQNEFFTDHYIELPIDLSKVLFICTANSTQTIPGPLLDRMEIIEVSSYTENEKYHIAKNYLLQKQKIKNGLQNGMLRMDNQVLRDMIVYYTRESGVRNLERLIGQVCRKAAKYIVTGEKTRVRVTTKNLSEFLGKKKYRIERANEKDQIGIVRGLAWTSVGGDTLEIEVNIMTGKGKFELTGQMGDIMKESAKTAISYVRSLADLYHISEIGRAHV